MRYIIILFPVLLIILGCKKEKEKSLCDKPSTAKIFGVFVPDSAQVYTPIIVDFQWRKDYSCEYFHNIDTFLTPGSIFFRLQTRMDECHCRDTFEYKYNSFTFSVDTPGPIAIQALIGGSAHFTDTIYIIP